MEALSESECSCGIRALSELNPTLTNAFRTADGVKAWSPSVLKEMTTFGSLYSFAMKQCVYGEFPVRVPILILRRELKQGK